MTYAHRLADEVEYDYEEGQGPVDELIAYKDALEETLEALELVLRRRGLTIEEMLRDGL